MISRSFSIVVFLLALCGAMVSESKRSEIAKSHGFSCVGKSFVSVSASEPDRRTVPQIVGLTVEDPRGQMSGRGRKRNEIPNSTYGPVIEIPSMPSNSRALALEVCNAPQGVWEITISELGDGPYRLVVRAYSDADNAETLVLEHTSKPKRIRHYRFAFRVQERRVTIRWIDKDEREHLHLEDSEW